MFKDLIIKIDDAGLTNTVYYGFHVLGLLLAFLNGLNDAKHLNVERWKAAVTILIVYPVIYELRYAVRYVENLFYPCEGANIIKVFIFLPVVIWPVAKLLKVSQTKLNQIFAVIPCIGQGVSHIGCIFPGCCNGYESTFGIYNYSLDCLCIPVQIYESIAALLIGLYLEIRFRKNKWKDDDKAMPIMFVLFGLSRFFLEFLRDDEKFLFNISNAAMHSMFMAIVGALWLLILRYKDGKQTSVNS